MTVLGRVLYEDKRDPRGKEFGPHLFVLACVADRVDQADVDVYGLRRAFEAVPLKGFGNVRRALQYPADYRSDGAVLLALVDGDQAWRGLALPREATDQMLIDALLDEASERAGVHVFILHDNLETLLAAVAKASGAGWDPSAKPSPTARDRILIDAATARSRPFRDGVLAEVPAVAALVDQLVSMFLP